MFVNNARLCGREQSLLARLMCGGRAGFSKNEVIGRNCRFMQGPDTDPSALDDLRSAIAAQQPVVVELINYRKDGSKFWNQVGDLGRKAGVAATAGHRSIVRVGDDEVVSI
jgi:hypothetical protein